jgi:hypothetical protein
MNVDVTTSIKYLPMEYSSILIKLYTMINWNSTIEYEFGSQLKYYINRTMANTTSISINAGRSLDEIQNLFLIKKFISLEIQ